MRLLHTTRLDFKEFFDEGVPEYAILSHRWGTVDEEVSFTDFKAGEKRTTPGYAKIIQFCELSSKRGFEYCRVDTCCIDKSSSAELTEAINSMYRWYEHAQVCFVHLKDVSSIANLTKSEWFERGWTLQELIAPEHVEFYNWNWQHLGSKLGLYREIAEATLVDVDVLKGRKSAHRCSVAARMSWAAPRRTSRLEDQAYCLLGLFEVNMPLLYGERKRAFQRLQEEIYANTADDSLFAWDIDPIRWDVIEVNGTILATSPAAFRNCGSILRISQNDSFVFEISHRQLTILVRQNYKPDVVQKLAAINPESLSETSVAPLLLTVPLACMWRGPAWRSGDVQYFASLELAYHHGSWHKRGLSWNPGLPPKMHSRLVDDSDYVRIRLLRGPPEHSGRSLLFSVKDGEIPLMLVLSKP